MNVRFTGVITETVEGKPVWVAEGIQTLDDGTEVRYRHLFPLDTLEWRAAEYGIDPADTATLLDIVLTEPHLSEEDWEAGHRLHDAPDIATARRDHLARCARAKLRHRLTTRTSGHPCRRVAAESPLHPEAISLKQQLVARARAARTATQQAEPPDRIAALRDAVNRGGDGGCS